MWLLWQDTAQYQNQFCGGRNLMKKQNLFANAIDKKALKKAMENPKSRKEITDILKKVRY